VRAVFEKGAGRGGAYPFEVRHGHLKACFVRHEPRATQNFVFSFDKVAAK
jgi:hypothetical protein